MEEKDDTEYALFSLSSFSICFAPWEMRRGVSLHKPRSHAAPGRLRSTSKQNNRNENEKYIKVNLRDGFRSLRSQNCTCGRIHIKTENEIEAGVGPRTCPHRRHRSDHPARPRNAPGRCVVGHACSWQLPGDRHLRED